MILKIEAQMTSKKRIAREKKEIKISLTFVDDIQKNTNEFCFYEVFHVEYFFTFHLLFWIIKTFTRKYEIIKWGQAGF